MGSAEKNFRDKSTWSASHKPARKPDRLMRLGGAIFVALIFFALLSTLFPVQKKSPIPAGTGRDSWVPVARGQVCFLGQWEEFSLHQKWEGDGRFRIKDGDTTFENPDLEAALKIFVRYRLSGVRMEEPLAIRLVQGFGLFHRPGRRGSPDVKPSWAFSLQEEQRGAETWYVAAPTAAPCVEKIEPARPPEEGPRWPGGLPLHARSTEDLKEKLAREISRQLVLYLTSV